MVLADGLQNGVIDANLRWKDRNIPYELSDDFDEKQKAQINEVLEREFAKTCISVKPRVDESDYVYVTGNNSGCWSQVGRIGGKQNLNLQVIGCVWNHTIVHEFLHAAGFYHQQSSTDRDDFVDIFWENIKPGREHNFNKHNGDKVTSFNEAYDYNSIMHYTKNAFTKNGKATILPKGDPTIPIGVAKVMSEIDIRKVKKMYECE
ncbi:zinc metalloproteinase nas-14-like [Photinus pyralis]|nr:zinc metalloproteinase nas-14-like [Photinus pyralis]